jgi:hypothetical protein
MSAWLVAACGLAYLYVAAEQALQRQWWTALVYIGYAVANVGAVMIVIRGIK